MGAIRQFEWAADSAKTMKRPLYVWENGKVVAKRP
jgi:hypothetical protein